MIDGPGEIGPFDMSVRGDGWSAGAILWWRGAKLDDRLELSLDVSEAGPSHGLLVPSERCIPVSKEHLRGRAANGSGCGRDDNSQAEPHLGQHGLLVRIASQAGRIATRSASASVNS